MDYGSKLTRLEQLLGLVERYIPTMYRSSDETKELHGQICQIYGEVSDVFDEAVGRQTVSVENDGPGASTYPNFFEAGFLSGRSIYTHQGTTGGCPVRC